MKISTTQEKLARALSAASRIASTRSGLPILGNILLRTDGKQLYVAATDLELALTERVGAKIEKPGSITAPARLISEFVSNLPKDTVTIEVTDSKIVITSANYSSTINGIGDEEFPELPRVEDAEAVQFSLTVDDFKEAASQTIIAASNDSTRPVLTGVYMHTYEGGLYFAATDGYRLAEKRITDARSD
ncbi:MAG TPA: DNA polymerase III subunit beta, partial [Candidatus Saccharimonadales bacterium]